MIFLRNSFEIKDLLSSTIMFESMMTIMFKSSLKVFTFGVYFKDISLSFNYDTNLKRR